jgi:hypothetical protein
MSNSDLSKGNKESLDLAVKIVLNEARKQARFGGDVYWESDKDYPYARFDEAHHITRPYNQEIRDRLYTAIDTVEDFFKNTKDWTSISNESQGEDKRLFRHEEWCASNLYGYVVINGKEVRDCAGLHHDD